MNIFDSTSSFLKRLRSRVRHDPERDWFVLLSVSAIVLASIIIWNVWAFGTVASGGIIGTPTTEAPTVFNSSPLEAIHTVFANRAAEESRYETGMYSFTDPSQ